MNLGQFIALLEPQRQDFHVVYNFGYFRPTTFHSWRGSYDELALGYDRASFNAGDMITVAQLLTLAKECIGKTFAGYKGGDYTMDANTRLWVANSSEACDTSIVSVEDDAPYLVIVTGFEHF